MNATEVCPARTLTSLGLASAAINKATAVCRRSWGRSGASRLVDPFELATWEELLALLDESGPEELLRQVRAAEAVDPEGRQWPRTKRSDDATAVYLFLADGKAAGGTVSKSGKQ